MLKRKVSVRTTDGTTLSLPITEFLVFATLDKLFREHGPVHGPAIARASDGELSISTVYGSLERLKKKGVVSSKEELFPIGPSEVRRVVWSPRARTVNEPTPEKVKHDISVPELAQ